MVEIGGGAVEAGLIFHFARRTDDCSDAIECAVKCFGINISIVKPCTNDKYLNSRIANMLKKVRVVFLVGRSAEKYPDCAESIFKTLRVPVDSSGEPKGVMELFGKEKGGYVIESVGQAIVLFPDMPDEINEMLPQMCKRLKEKFGLEGNLRAPALIDCKKLTEDCLKHSEGYGKIF